jgi:hypothetical protein
MKLSDGRIDPSKLEDGSWVDNVPELLGVRFKVRGTNNKDWRKLNARLIDATPRKRRMGGRLDPDEQDRIMNELLLKTCLLDWDGIEDDDGKPLPYSLELARKLLNDPSLQKFREGVIWAATVVAEGGAVEIEEVVKN